LRGQEGIVPKVVLPAFINCPFDAQCRDCFEAIVFSCIACGIAPRVSLSNGGATTLRYTALVDLVGEAAIKIHDLSRTESDDKYRPRFNMPFELGLFLGAKDFGGAKHKAKRTVVMVREPYTLGAYLSDLAGLDPIPHHNDPSRVVKIGRDSLNAHLSAQLGQARAGKVLPGPKKSSDAFKTVQPNLPRIAEAAGFESGTVNVIDAHHDYPLFVDQFPRNGDEGGW
jgi:hypothetical protein